MKNVVVSVDFVGEMVKAFMLNVTYNLYLSLTLEVYKNIIEAVREICIYTE